MNSKAAKIGSIALIVIVAVLVYVFKLGPFEEASAETKAIYEKLIKTEATIVSQEGNGRVGKSAATIWTLQFKDAGGNLKTATMQQSSFMPKENGEKVIIYVDPENPGMVRSEETYTEVMK